MYQPDYDLAASHWIERDRDSVHMDQAALKEKLRASSVHTIHVRLRQRLQIWCAIHQLNITL